VDLLDTIRTSIYATPVTTEYLLNAFIKLTTRFQQPTQIDRIRNILSQNTGNLNVELQQRAVEYKNLFDFDDIRKGVVERMPAPEIREENRVLGEVTTKKTGKRRSAPIKQTAQTNLLDILGGGDEAESSTNDSGFGEQAKNAELLKDLFGPSSSQPTTNGSVSQPVRSNVNDIMDLFGSSGRGITPVASPPPAIAIGSGSMSNLDELFGRTAATSPPPTQSYRSSPFDIVLIFSSDHGIFQE
jgi:AP-1 complex subunit gamma-1